MRYFSGECREIQSRIYVFFVFGFCLSFDDSENVSVQFGKKFGKLVDLSETGFCFTCSGLECWSRFS